MKVTIIDEKIKKQFEDLKIGDIFMVEGSMPLNNIYIKTVEKTISKESIRINCLNLNKGFFTYIQKDEIVVVPKEASITITI